jgi:hypothetical protein
LLTALAACASRRPGPSVAIPTPEAGRIGIRARSADHLGDVQPIAIGLTNGTSTSLRLDPRQIFALRGDERIASLPPGEAARRAGGRRMPGAVRGAAVGAASGGVLGALGGLISGAIQGGIGTAVAVGSAVGAGVGAVTGVFTGGRHEAPDVTGFEDRALPASTLEPGFSSTGYVYYPAGTYERLEILLAEPGAAVRTERVTIDQE